jgi:hemoglobin/transferrin/lactoferrin receptor protein
MRLFSAVFTLLMYTGLIAQIKVVNSILQPIAGVQLFENSNYLGISDDGGVLYVDTASIKNDSWVLIHANYHSKKIIRKSFANGTTFILTKKTTSFTPIVITPRYGQRVTSDIVAAVDVLQRTDIDLFQPQTSADMININQKVFVQKSQQGGGSPIIRGFATNRILLVVDGVRMNTAIFRTGNVQNVLNIDPFGIETSEVLFGPASQFYGSDAIGGVLSFNTKQTPFRDTLAHNGNVNIRFSSASREGTWHFDYGVGTKQFSSFTSISFSNFEDLKMGKKGPDEYLRPDYVVYRKVEGDTLLTNPNPNEQVFSGYRQINLMQKFAFKLSKHQTIRYGIHWSNTSNIPRYDRLTLRADTGLKNGDWYYGPQQWLMNNVSYTNKKRTPLSDNIQITLAQQSFQESRNDRRFGTRLLKQRTEDLLALSTNIDIQKRLTRKIDLSYGAEYIHNGLKSKATIFDITKGTTLPTSTRYPDGSRWGSIGTYINLLNKWNIRHTTEGGLRYNRVTTRGRFDSAYNKLTVDHYDNTNMAITGSVSHVIKIRNGNIGTILSTAFKSPNIDDITKVFDSNPGFVTVPNPSLKPEYAYNAEINGEYFFADKIKFSSSLFYTFLSDALTIASSQLNGLDSILYDGEMSKVQKLVNQNYAAVYGAQLSMQYQISPMLSLMSSYTILKSSASNDEPVRHITPNFGGTSLRCNFSKGQLVAYSTYNQAFENSQFTMSEQEDEHLYAKDKNGLPYSPAWAIVNLRYVYPITPKININVAAENILDKRYRPYSSGITAPGRNLIFSIQAQL